MNSRMDHAYDGGQTALHSAVEGGHVEVRFDEDELKTPSLTASIARVHPSPNTSQLTTILVLHPLQFLRSASLIADCGIAFGEQGRSRQGYEQGTDSFLYCVSERPLEGRDVFGGGWQGRDRQGDEPRRDSSLHCVLERPLGSIPVFDGRRQGGRWQGDGGWRNSSRVGEMERARSNTQVLEGKGCKGLREGERK